MALPRTHSRVPPSTDPSLFPVVPSDENTEMISGAAKPAAFTPLVTTAASVHRAHRTAARRRPQPPPAAARVIVLVIAPGFPRYRSSRVRPTRLVVCRGE